MVLTAAFDALGIGSFINYIVSGGGINSASTASRAATAHVHLGGD